MAVIRLGRLMAQRSGEGSRAERDSKLAASLSAHEKRLLLLLSERGASAPDDLADGSHFSQLVEVMNAKAGERVEKSSGFTLKPW